MPAVWTHDCQGKQDFDGALVTLATRYWPRGGGFTLMEHRNGAILIIEENDARPEIQPSAHATVYLGSTANEHFSEAVELCDFEARADTEQEVKAQVEAWAAEQFERIRRALLALYGVVGPAPAPPTADEATP